MKIIHTSDLHLDSKVDSCLGGTLGRERRLEILETFVNLVSYAKDEGALAIIIAGGLFDKPHVRKGVKKRVLEVIKSAEEIDFLYLMGGLRNSDFLMDVPEDEVPKNLKMFREDEWTGYDYGNIIVWGRELSRENQRTISVNLILDESKQNIVVVHGRETNYTGPDSLPAIQLSKFKNKFIDYLALGDSESYADGRLDERGFFCYPGVLEGRSFEEAGEKGFVLLDINETERTISHRFVPFAERRFVEVEAGISEEMNVDAVFASVEKAVEGLRNRDFVRVLLTGSRAMDMEIDTDDLVNKLGKRFYYFDIKDKTSIRIDYDAYMEDKSLKGEFVRLMQMEALPEEERTAIIDLGIRAILGEEV